MRQFATSFYSSEAWKNARETAMRRDRYLCVECLKQGVYKPSELVHHIVHLSPRNINDANITLNPANLESVCRDCHATIHHAEPERRYKVDADGNIAAK